MEQEKSKINKNVDPFAINLLVYGCVAFYLGFNGKQRIQCIFYILEEDNRYLQWISMSNLVYSESRIYLPSIKSILDNPIWKKNNNASTIPYLYINIDSQKADITIEFSSQQTKQIFRQGLEYFIKKSIDKNENENGDSVQNMALDLFINSDKDGDRKLDEKEIEQLMIKLNININKKYLNDLLKKYDLDNNSTIDQEEFLSLIKDINSKSELKEVFLKYAHQADKSTPDHLPIMEINEFMKFMQIEQKEESNIDLIKQQISKLSSLQSDQQNVQKISFYTFSNYIFSNGNSIFDNSFGKIYQDMNMPLSNYYINSSHNTYLLSNQLTGQSSTQAYINALMQGCRCVELDCWNGDPEPIIYHGHTLTSKIQFRDVLKVIKQHGFAKTPYPVILSIENHCDFKNKTVMANIIQQEIGDILFKIPKNYKEIKFYPSPNQLKNRIIIKDKAKILEEYALENENFQILTHQISKIAQRQPNKIYNPQKKKEYNISDFFTIYQQAVNIKYDVRDNLLQSPYIIDPQTIKQQQEQLRIAKQTQQIYLQEEQQEEDNIDQDNQQNDDEENPITFGDTSMNNIDTDYKSQSTANDTNQTNQNNPQKSKNHEGKKQVEGEKHQECHQLNKLVTLYGNSFNLEKQCLCWHVSSLDESKLQNLLKTKQQELVDFHKQFFTRIYPAGLRVDSSNYDPIPGFIAGSQIIALNYQTNDFNKMIYKAKFQQNGGDKSGYLLKPDWMLYNTKNPKYPNDFVKPIKLLKITIISCQQLTAVTGRKKKLIALDNVIDPIITVSLTGLQIDVDTNKTQETDVVENNGFHPIFQKGDMKFTIHCPDQAIVIFEVFDQDVTTKVKVGQYAINFNCIRKGYRVIPLWNESLDETPNSYILAKIDIIDL